MVTCWLPGSFRYESIVTTLVAVFKWGKLPEPVLKMGSSEEFIDLAAKDVICLPLGGVSEDRALAVCPL